MPKVHPQAPFRRHVYTLPESTDFRIVRADGLQNTTLPCTYEVRRPGYTGGVVYRSIKDFGAFCVDNPRITPQVLGYLRGDLWTQEATQLDGEDEALVEILPKTGSKKIYTIMGPSLWAIKGPREVLLWIDVNAQGLAIVHGTPQDIAEHVLLHEDSLQTLDPRSILARLSRYFYEGPGSTRSESALIHAAFTIRYDEDRYLAQLAQQQKAKA